MELFKSKFFKIFQSNYSRTFLILSDFSIQDVQDKIIINCSVQTKNLKENLPGGGGGGGGGPPIPRNKK